MKVKYSKNKLVVKRWTVRLAISVILLLAAYFGFNIYLSKTNMFVYENINDDSKRVNPVAATNSTPIIINNLVIGGIYNDDWVSMNQYFLNSTNKEQYDVDVFTRKGKSGTFKLNYVESDEEITAVYTTTTRTNYRDEYYAVKSGSAVVSKMDEITLDDTTTKVFENNVKEALGYYKLFNGTVKIREVYEVALVPGQISYIISATNEGKTGSGVYSTVVYVDNMGKASLVKYNYVKNVDNSEDFSIYTIKFVADLNGDQKAEIILQETKEYNTKYSVMEYTDDKFYEVLSTKINN